MQEKVYLFNPGYRLKNDKKRILLYSQESINPMPPGIGNFLGILHPVFAILLSLFDGHRNLAGVLAEFFGITGIPSHIVEPLVVRLVNNSTTIRLHLGEMSFLFPQNTLIPAAPGRVPVIKYTPEDLMLPASQLDLKSTRLYHPLDCSLIINNLCATRCLYCYVDKRQVVPCTIPLPRLKEIVSEAKALGMRSFNISGGEVFSYPHWYELLSELTAHGFFPHISTKFPLNSERIQRLFDLGFRRIQLSLDTVEKPQMVSLLRVHESYHTKILKTLELLDHKGFEITVNGQITAINQDSMDAYFAYLLQFPHIRYIRVRATGFSRFIGDKAYHQIRPEMGKLEEIRAKVVNLNSQYGNRVGFEFFDFPREEEYVGCSLAEKAIRFNQRAQCSGNFSAFHILPDGRVTICEELYYHPRFIIGDLSHQSIQEVWDGDEARALNHFSRDCVRPESACKTCPDFEPCHQEKGACWKMTLYAYGDNNWDFPDPNCPHAPKPLHDFWIPSARE